jgi:DNA sulfur modification protein DndD
LYAEKDDIGRQLKGASQEEIAKLERRRQEYQADVESHLMEIGHLIIQLGQLDQEISELAESIKEARKDERREQVLAEKVKLAQDAADAVRSIYETFAENMRQRIEAKTKEIFKGLVWKDSHFQDVRLEQNYMLEVIDRFGMPARPELSAGERQVLSLSFITAMSKVAQESVDVEAPLVMDTPFGRLSSAHRESITANIPALAPQLVLFVTDEELREKARENLEPRIGAEYRLTFNGATSCTTIEEIG